MGGVIFHFLNLLLMKHIPHCIKNIFNIAKLFYDILSGLKNLILGRIIMPVGYELIV